MMASASSTPGSVSTTRRVNRSPLLGSPAGFDGSDLEARAEDPANEVRIGAEVVEARDVARLERRPLVGIQGVTGEILFGHALSRRVLLRQRGQELVEPVGRLRGHRTTLAPRK